MNLRIVTINVIFIFLIGFVTAYVVSSINKMKPNSETLYGYEIDMVKDERIDSSIALQK